MHLLCHKAFMLQMWGPSWATHIYSHERLNNRLGKLNLSHRHGFRFLFFLPVSNLILSPSLETQAFEMLGQLLDFQFLTDLRTTAELDTKERREEEFGDSFGINALSHLIHVSMFYEGAYVMNLIQSSHRFMDCSDPSHIDTGWEDSGSFIFDRRNIIKVKKGRAPAAPFAVPMEVRQLILDDSRQVLLIFFSHLSINLSLSPLSGSVTHSPQRKPRHCLEIVHD